MKATELHRYAATPFLRECDPAIAEALQPAFGQLLADLLRLPENADQASLLAPFEQVVSAANVMADDIQTVDREAILGAIYDIGDIVGLDRNSQFAESWRGDW